MKNQSSFKKPLLLFIIILSSFYTLKAQNWNEIIKATASDAAAGDNLGVSVSISGNKAIVGAGFNDDNGTSSGAAYIFELVGNTWSETAKITASDAATADFFGFAVSISGNKAIVGAAQNDDNGTSSGSAYIFELVGGTWSETTKITASDAATSDGFGVSVSISGNKAIVGAAQNDDNGSNSGSAYIFELVGGTWSETAKITASDAAASDGFGYSVSISGNKATVGALGNSDNGFGSGSAYIFELVVGTWSETTKITASDATTGDGFGYSISISGNKAIVGAHQNDDNGTSSGSAYIFELVAGTWSETTKITASDAASDDFFGYSVSISGNKAVAGARQNDDNGSNSGSAYIFELIAGTWSETEKITASDAATNDIFGSSVSISGNQAIVGAARNDDNGSNSGSIYIFEPCITSGTETVSTCNSYVFNGITYTSNNNTATDTLTNAAGCDSIITLNLTINNNTGTETVSACNSYVFNGITYTTNNNTVTDTLINAAGCDSIVTLNLTINNNTGIETASVCDSYVFNGITYTTNNNTAKDTLTNAAGCDSIVTLNLTITNSSTGTETVSACDNYLFNSITYTSNNNTAKDTLTNAAGCDSIVTLNLTITNSSTGTETVSTCNSYVFNGITYTSNNNTAKDTLTNAAGCDSIITLNLTINNNTGTETVSACNSYVFNGITYTTNNNTATETLTNAAGCDSIVTLNLTINNLNALIVNVSNDTLTTANQIGATYQWIDCSDSSIIVGATDSTYIATANGDYAIVVTIGLCVDTSTCSNVNITGLNSYQNVINKQQLYPNPTKSHVTIANFNSSISTITIIDITGKIIESFQPKTAIIDLSNYDKGIYFVRIQNSENTITERVIKQ